MTKFFSKKMIVITIAVIIAILLIYYILPVSIPLITAIVTALLLDPAVKMLERRFKIKRKLAVLIVFIIFMLAIGVLSYFVITKVVGEGVKLVEDMPAYINQLSDIWLSYEKQLTNAAKDLPIEIVTQTSNEVQDFLNSFKNSLRDYLDIEKISAFLAYIPNYLVSFLVYLIALFMFMLDLPRIKQTLFSHLTERTAEKVNFMTSRLSYVIFGFFKEIGRAHV